jgi:hypothetical protein
MCLIYLPALGYFDDLNENEKVFESMHIAGLKENGLYFN